MLIILVFRFTPVYSFLFSVFRLRMRPNVVLKQLSIDVGSSDQSYMPQHVVVTAGRDEQNLKAIGDCRIPRYSISQDFLLSTFPG